MKNTYTYLAYGSNLNENDWKRFCERNGFPTDLLCYKGPVRLPDYQLTSDHYSTSRGGGALNVKPASGHYVDAVAFTTDDKGVEALRLKEGHPFAYVETKVIALEEDGSELEAVTYIVPEEASSNFVAPTREYYEICKEGYEAFGLCTKNLTLASKGEKPEPLSAIFTYGTLMRGQQRHDLIARYDSCSANVDLALTGTVKGCLTTNGSYPGLDQKSDQTTHGDLLRVSNIEEVLNTADSIEGFQTFGSQGNLFRRTLTYVCTGGFEKELAWVYVYDGHLGQEVPSNDWRVHTRCKLRFFWGLLETYGQFDPSFFDRLDETNNVSISKTDQIHYSGLEQNLCLGRLSERDLASAAGFFRAWPKESFFPYNEHRRDYENTFFRQLEGCRQ